MGGRCTIIGPAMPIGFRGGDIFSDRSPTPHSRRGRTARASWETRGGTVTHRPGKLSGWPATSCSPATACVGRPAIARRPWPRSWRPRVEDALPGPGPGAFLCRFRPAGPRELQAGAEDLRVAPRPAVPAGAVPARDRGASTGCGPRRRARRGRGVRRRRAAAGGSHGHRLHGRRPRPGRPRPDRARTAPRDCGSGRPWCSSGSTCTARWTIGRCCAGASRSAVRSGWCSGPSTTRCRTACACATAPPARPPAEGSESVWLTPASTPTTRTSWWRAGATA